MLRVHLCLRSRLPGTARPWRASSWPAGLVRMRGRPPEKRGTARGNGPWGQRSAMLPELNEDVTAEILLRILPDDPENLFRASIICKRWLRVVSEPAFLRRYRTFCRGAPLLGFFYSPDSEGSFPGFVPTTTASSPPQPGRCSTWDRWVSDCRHGRVLLTGGSKTSKTFEVWDPISNRWDELEAPRSLNTFNSNAVVPCAMPGCDHSSCLGGPFNVICVGVTSSNSNYVVRAHVYSSESGSWRTPASAQLDSPLCYFDLNRAALIGDGFYCTVDDGDRILKYDLVEHRSSVIDMPHLYVHVPVLMQNEHGSLGIAGVEGSTLYLWSTIVTAVGVTGWVKQRVIELKEIILPVDIISDRATVIGFAEGVEVFFINTNAGAFTFELKSGRVRKVDKPRKDYHGVTPFISFFTPDCGCSKWTK